MHVKYGGFDQNGSSASDKKLLNCRYSLKIELTKIYIYFDVGYYRTNMFQNGGVEISSAVIHHICLRKLLDVKVVAGYKSLELNFQNIDDI